MLGLKKFPADAFTLNSPIPRGRRDAKRRSSVDRPVKPLEPRGFSHGNGIMDQAGPELDHFASGERLRTNSLPLFPRCEWRWDILAMERYFWPAFDSDIVGLDLAVLLDQEKYSTWTLVLSFGM